jgi:hypothetical protein
MVLAALAATAAAAGCSAGTTTPQQSNLGPTPSPMSASQVRQSVREQCDQSREQTRKAHPDAVISDCNYGEGTLTIGRDNPQAPPPATQPPPPLTQQVHDALLAALRADPSASQAPVPYSDVGVCTGPTAGGAGAYRCATTPRGPSGVRSVTVDVRADGGWAARPLPAQTTLHGRRTIAQTGVWGVGLRLR